jgi:arylsulfatase A-like enzyme
MKKNVLLLTIDAFGADKCWGLKKTLTPNIRSFSKKGAIFTSAISTTSSTTPSMASIHTGFYPFQHGIKSTYGFHLENSIKTLAENFKSHGYETFSNVGGPLKPSTGLNRGFDSYRYRAAHLMVPFFKWKFAINVAPINNFFLMHETISIFRRPEPWFYWIHLLDLHNRWRPKRWIANKMLSGYEQALASLDKKIGKLLNEVDTKRTLIVISADHGHHVSTIDPKRVGINYSEAHGFHVYDTLVKIPLIIVCTDLIPEGLIVEKQISTIDLLPTILDLLGYKQTNSITGQSFAGLLKKEEGITVNYNSKRFVYMEACGSILKRAGKSFLMGIRSPDWKLVVPKEGNSKQNFELFDLKKDPDELVNVYDKYPQIANQLLNELKIIIAKPRL